MQTTRCPNCNSDVIIDDELKENDLITCTNCQADLEIITLHPLQLKSLDDELDRSVNQ